MASTKVEAVLVALVFLSPTLAFSRDHNAIIENLLSFGETQLIVFTDGQDLSKIVDLKRLKVPAKVFNVLDLRPDLKPKPCPTEYNLQDDFKHDPLDLGLFDHKHHTIVVHVKKVDKVMAVFDRTVVNCSFFLEPGIYNLENRFLFLADPDENVTGYAEEIFNSSPHIANHR